MSDTPNEEPAPSEAPAPPPASEPAPAAGPAPARHPGPAAEAAPNEARDGAPNEARDGAPNEAQDGERPPAMITALTAPPSAAGRRLDRWLTSHYPKMPRALVQKLSRQRRLRVDGARAKADTRLAGGDRVEIRADLSGFETASDLRERRATRLRADPKFKGRFRVLDEDDAIIVLDKPPGIVVHPSRGHHRGDSLLDLLKTHLPEAFTEEADFRPAFVHRLDRGTSGVIVAAKTREAAGALEAAFRERRVRKVYRALVVGTPRDERGRIDSALRRRGGDAGPTRYEVDDAAAESSASDPPPEMPRPPEAEARATPETAARPEASGDPKEARTEFRTLWCGQGLAWVEVAPETGRTHQIRVHLASLGLPVVGDGDYGDKRRNRRLAQRLDVRHSFLHAARLTFPHPITGKEVEYRAELRPHLARALEDLGVPSRHR